MISSPSSKRRLLVPRWRTLSLTLAAGELSSPGRRGQHASAEGLSRDLRSRLANWRQTPTVIHAAEVVEAAIAHGQEHLALDAATKLAQEGSGATIMVRQQAGKLLQRAGRSEGAYRPLVAKDEGGAGAYWRARTRAFPHDALAWVELALAQLTHGHSRSAQRSITIALNLAGNNRHVLRSAARFFLHVHDPERAYQLIRRSEATPHDPWLMAAEIAFAQCVDRPSAFMKAGVNLLKEGSQNPRQVTELAGAIGTTLLIDGNRKLSKRHFLQSLADPTGNSLAQAEWASGAFGEPIVLERQLERYRDAKEALALHAYSAGQFEASVAFAREWIAEEPFSARGYIVGASAANTADDFAAAEALSKEGLSFDPKSISLLNSLAFALASQGRLDEADDALRQIPDEHKDKNLLLVADANRGLVAMRRGEIDKGRNFYRKVIQSFRSQQNPHLARSAQTYWAREATRAGVPDGAEILEEARKGLIASPNSVAARVLKEAETYLMSSKHSTTELKRRQY
jgi:tetratricopeptide (TPR) repeat protein